MSEHIRLEFNARESAKMKGNQKRWECTLNGQPVGHIVYSPDRQWKKADYIAYVFSCENPDTYGFDSRRTDTAGEYNSLYAAKVGMLEKAKAFLQYLNTEKRRKAPVTFLPAADFEFYPTPSGIAGRLLAGVNFNKVKTVLEPSAGKGDLLDYASQRKRTYRFGRERGYSRGSELECDCIEIDTNLQAILTSRGYRVVHDDFLSFVTRKRYDLILMNPPFSEGDLHLLHAIDLCENGGQIACILNAETLHEFPARADEEADGGRRVHPVHQRCLCQGRTPGEGGRGPGEYLHTVYLHRRHHMGESEKGSEGRER